MAAALAQALGSNQSKTAGTSLAISLSKVVTTGNVIVLAFGSDDVGTAHSVSATGATVSWSKIEETINAGACKAQFWVGTITAGGTLTQIQISWTTNVTAKAMVASEWSGVGALSVAGAGSTSATSSCTAVSSKTIPANGAAFGACVYEDTNNNAITGGNSSGTPSTTSTLDAQNGTTGGGASSNIAVALVYATNTSQVTSFSLLSSHAAGNANNAGAGALYNPSAVAFIAASPVLVRQAVPRASAW
jgi:hypothetical protein